MTVIHIRANYCDHGRRLTDPCFRCKFGRQLLVAGLLFLSVGITAIAYWWFS